MLYLGRNLDVLSLWSEYLDLPNGISEPLPSFLPKVVCPNPNHDTRKRHFQVNTRQPLVHCFAECGISGTYEHAIQVILGLESEREARRLILGHTRTALGGEVLSLSARSGTRKTLTADDPVAKDERALAGGSFQYLPKSARHYLDNRGIDEGSRGLWQLGYDEDEHRLVIPAYDERGRFRFLIKRDITGNGSLKYLYTAGTIKTSLLFGANHVDRVRVRAEGLIVVEGSLDTILQHQHGFTNTGGILGTGISWKQAKIIDALQPPRIYLFFDRDLAGVKNIVMAHEKLRRYPLFVLRYPGDKTDPAEMGKEATQRAIDRALPIASFLKKARTMRLTKEYA